MFDSKQFHSSIIASMRVLDRQRNVSLGRWTIKLRLLVVFHFNCVRVCTSDLAFCPHSRDAKSSANVTFSSCNIFKLKDDGHCYTEVLSVH